MIDELGIRQRFEALEPLLDERGRRRLAAAEARSAGSGGVSAVSRITGIARSTIGRALKELRGEARPTPKDRVRRHGGGRKPMTQTDPTLLPDLQGLVDPATRGDPMSPLRWTSKSLHKLAAELQALGHQVGPSSVSKLLKHLGFSLQANRKTLEGTEHPDRDAQFEYINAQTKAALAAGDPAISVDTKKVDTKKKELVGDFKNGGREYRPKGQPEPVRVHDFKMPELGRASPYGVYDIGDNRDWVSVGMDHDTASFAVNAIRRWWRTMGKDRYPDSKILLINADGGGSNGVRLRLWKYELQNLADELDLTITVCHLPPGTPRHKQVEQDRAPPLLVHHQNWRGRPLVSYQTIVELIAATTTKKGLKVQAELDTNDYPTGITDEQMSCLNIQRHDFHGEWNYTIRPGRHP